LSNKRFRLWLAPLTQSNLSRYVINLYGVVHVQMEFTKSLGMA